MTRKLVQTCFQFKFWLHVWTQERLQDLKWPIRSRSCFSFWNAFLPLCILCSIGTLKCCLSLHLWCLFSGWSSWQNPDLHNLHHPSSSPFVGSSLHLICQPSVIFHTQGFVLLQWPWLLWLLTCSLIHQSWKKHSKWIMHSSFLSTHSFRAVGSKTDNLGVR